MRSAGAGGIPGTPRAATASMDLPVPRPATDAIDLAESSARSGGSDRRSRPTRRFSRYTFYGGRRRTVRREHEREGSYVDVHGSRLWFMVLWVAFMNLGDTFFTLVHLQSGGIELNPVARSLLTTGREGFVLSKSLLIGLALCVLVIHKNFSLARIGLYASVGTYTLLVLYHLSLFRV